MSWIDGARLVSVDLVVALNGLLVGLSLIVAIGAQNAFVLRQGLLGAHVGAVVAICAVSDALLIAAGVGGLGALVQSAPVVLEIIKWVGAAFLLCYAGLALRRAVIGGSGLVAQPAEPASAKNVGPSTRAEGSTVITVPAPPRQAGRSGLAAALLTCTALTWLNPHVYLDTVLLLGSIAQRSENRWLFAVGAMSGSLIWFAALGFGARLLRPIFARPGSWRVLDVLIAATMATIAVRLLVG